MAIDPICGMHGPRDQGASADRGGQTYYFCCEHCRQKFLADGQPAMIQLGMPAHGHHDHHAAAAVQPQRTVLKAAINRRAPKSTSAPCVRAWRATRRQPVPSAAWRWSVPARLSGPPVGHAPTPCRTSDRPPACRSPRPDTSGRSTRRAASLAARSARDGRGRPRQAESSPAARRPGTSGGNARNRSNRSGRRAVALRLGLVDRHAANRINRHFMDSAGSNAAPPNHCTGGVTEKSGSRR